MLKTSQLTKQFPGPNGKAVLAVDHLDLQVSAGQVFGFLGPNGAGKTTTVRMLTSLIAPTSGEAWVNNFKVGREDREIRRTVGILTESPGMYDRLSAEKNLTIYAHLYEVRDIKGQVEKYLRMLGLWDRRDDVVGGFSKGMKQKLAICRALLHEPKMLFLDEPTAGLDPEAAKLVNDFIRELKTEGRTIFINTHNLDEADRLCDRIGVIKQKLLIVDSPENLRQRLYGRQVVFHLRQAPPAVMELVRGLAFVREVQSLTTESGDKLVIALDNPEEQNPIVIRKLVEAGVDIQFVGELRHSLEEIYLKLINTPGPAGSGE
ncbi:MAG: ABC transporter ATP-binding protein [Anaerolineae bacterium]